MARAEKWQTAQIFKRKPTNSKMNQDSNSNQDSRQQWEEKQNLFDFVIHILLPLVLTILIIAELSA